MTGSEDRLHDVRETASRMAVSPKTIERLIRKGCIRAVKIGRSVRIAESEIRRVAKDGAR